MDQPAVDNDTDFIVHPQRLVDRDGEKLVAMVKSTWELPAGERELELAPEDRQRGLRAVDLPWGLPGESSPLLPPDFCVRKAGTDVVVAARAHAPGGKPAPSFDVSVRVGPATKVLRIFGLRVWQDAGIGLSEPRPVREADLRWELAWGGADFDDEGRAAEEPRNTIGRGVVLDRNRLTHQPAPQIEDPFHPIVDADTAPAPAGVGSLMPHWEPRRSHYGTYDDDWLDQRAPLPPPDEDDRAYNVATPDLILPEPLRGGEEVALAGMSPGGGSVELLLPRVSLVIEFDVPGRDKESFSPVIDTVVIDQLLGPVPGRPVVEMVWRAAVPAPERMKEARVVVRERTTR